MSDYRRRILDLVVPLLAARAPFRRALDFGAGDGWFARELAEARVADEIVPVDVQLRRHHHVTPQLYDGRRLPFDDRAFELAYAMDVLHHCPDPRASLADLARCTSRYLLLKDHTFATRAGWLALGVLDELGNRRFGIPSRYRYQRRWEWLPVLADAGFVVEQMIHPAPCHTGLLGRATNRLQFVALFRRA